METKELNRKKFKKNDGHNRTNKVSNKKKRELK